MNQEGILGAPPVAPAGSTEPSQEDRWLAAAAYLGYFTGFWLVVPIVIYVLRRDRSRFVAHHALRAVVLHVLAIPVFVLSWGLALALAFGLAAIDRQGWGGRDAFGLLMSLAVAFGWMAPWLLYLAICTLAAVGAARGRLSTRSLLGRVVERFLGADRTVVEGAPPRT